MLGQRLTVRIITAEYLPAQQLHKLRYEVISPGSPFHGDVDIAYSSDPRLRAGHTYFVSMSRDSNPRASSSATARSPRAFRSERFVQVAEGRKAAGCPSDSLDLLWRLALGLRLGRDLCPRQFDQSPCQLLQIRLLARNRPDP